MTNQELAYVLDMVSDQFKRAAQTLRENYTDEYQQQYADALRALDEYQDAASTASL